MTDISVTMTIATATLDGEPLGPWPDLVDELLANEPDLTVTEGQDGRAQASAVVDGWEAAVALLRSVRATGFDLVEASLEEAR